ncbi:phosphatase domain-containing protein [Yimella sp. RIT 621]|uniref:phosphatase domain-containing protein n=1 Tax=unclassified Yimella TaxID=2649892 RepID=UPI00101B6937|nr:phosphatase domain-containing protein [Yimella sp. RIT 621]MCG8654127.1 App1 family protein [Yimella sp. NH-Cas1]RYG77291.1 DUF2183 domain-containing protein [Yimella sp. RIT 621]
MSEEHVDRIHRLQEGWTRRHEEREIVDIFCSVHGEELTQLKNALNRRDDHHDLEELIFGDIDDESVRERVLDHFAAQAEPLGRLGVKVLSDIDDTVFPMIHETRYPHGHFLVPGSLAFLQALDDGPTESPWSRGDLTFLTARPEIAFGLIESNSKDVLRKAGVASSSLLAGSLMNLHSKDAMADGKVANFAHYRKLFPEYGVVFVGDSGQGDVLVGQRVRTDYPDAVSAVFIHDVVGTPAARREELAASGVHVFETYIGAAMKAYSLGLVSLDNVKRVVTESLAALDDIDWETAEQEASTRKLLQRDADEALALG